MKNIIFIAPPAAGKGTISDLLVKNYKYKHISTGDLLRDEINSGSEFGQMVDKIISTGQLVSDDIIIKLVMNKIATFKENEAFILDGFPRTLEQAKKLDEILEDNNLNDNLVVYLQADLDLVLQRVLGRIICPKCKRSYNMFNDKFKPLVDNVCDDCGSALEKRADDNEETFKKRFNTFLEHTKDILTYYENKNILMEVNAADKIDDIVNKIILEANKEHIND